MGEEKRYARKVHQQGNSLSVGIPSDIVECMGIKKGHEFEVVYVEGEEEIILKRKKEATLPEGVDSDFMVLLEDVLKDYDEAIKNLKDR